LTNAAFAAAEALDRDLALVARAAGGDDAAFDDLLEPRLERLFRMARAILRDESRARDVVQEACVHAWRELGSLRAPGRFDAWLSQIVVNGCRTELRRSNRRAVREITLDESAGQGVPSQRVGGSPVLGDQVVEAEAVRRAFVRLDADDRALLVLHYVEDRPVAEIATALRIPSGTVKWRLSRARGALERALEAER
jgi:RNA polymerase sigma-70 factor (ECF subfamily)